MLAARFQTFCQCHCRLRLPVVDIVGFIVSVTARSLSSCKMQSEVPLPLKQCSFERIYFSRGNDAGVYREREELGRLLLPPLLKLLGENSLSLANTVLPGTFEFIIDRVIMIHG